MTENLKHFTDTNAVATIRTRTQALLDAMDAGVEPTADQVRQMAADLFALADDSDHWYRQADHWRESYRLAKGLSDDELNADVAIQEALRPHPRPCRFPDSPDCTCA